jgi:hypothetical protein
MTEVMAWLLVVLVVAMPVILGLLSFRRRKSTVDSASYETMVELHGIRRRLEVAQFKTELRRDAARSRRELRAELGALGKRERRP